MGTSYVFNKHLVVLVLSSLLALSAATLALLVDGRSAEAAGGGRVPECGGG